MTTQAQYIVHLIKSETLPITSTKSAAVARFQEEDLEDVTFSVQQMKLSSVRGVQAALGYAPRGACFAIYSGAVPLHPSHRVLMSALSRGSAPPVVGSFITVKDLLHYWIHILYINSKEEDEGLKKVLILPELFHVDMDLFLNLVQITGLKPYLLAEVDTHVLEVDVAIEELEVTTNQLQRQIRQLVHGNASAAVLFDRVGGVYSVAPADAFATKVDAFATQVDDGGENDVFHLELDHPMKSVDFHCDTCRERHRCNAVMTTEEDKLMFNELYPKDGFVIYLDPTSTNVIFCPYYPHIDYERIFLTSGKELETPTSEDNSPSVRLIKTVEKVTYFAFHTFGDRFKEGKAYEGASQSFQPQGGEIVSTLESKRKRGISAADEDEADATQQTARAPARRRLVGKRRKTLI